jgi:formylmethanofuran dehydrogenase subunit E
MNEEMILVCHRISDHPSPAVKSMAKRCSWCGQGVWQAYSSPPIGKLICAPCFARKYQDDVDVVEPPTPEQLRDIFRKGS